MKFLHSAFRLIAAAGMAIASIAGVSAQTSGVGAAFVNAPQSVFPLLDKPTRLDMLDYYSSNLATPSTNALDGKSRIVALSPDKLTIEMTGASTYTISLLPKSGGDSIIAVITTIATPAPDSRIDFYTKGWEHLSTENFFEKPALADWLTAEGKQNTADVEAFVPFVLIGYDYNPETSLLTLTNNTSKFLPNEINDLTSGYLQPSLAYRWTGKKFQAVKK